MLHTLELLSCMKYQFSAKNDQNGQFSIKLREKVRMVTCSFKSLDGKFLDQIIHMQSLNALSTQD